MKISPGKRCRFGPSLIAVFLIVIYAAHAYPQDRKSFLWRVKSQAGTVYLLGSIHLLKKDVYPLDPRIEEAFNQAAVLAVEADVNTMKRQDIQKVAAAIFYPSGDTMEKHVSAATYARVQAEASRLGLPPEYVKKQKPWFLALTLPSFILMKSGYNPKDGIDMHFLARAGEKKIVELESLNYQMNLLSGFSEKEQDLLLQCSLKDLRIVTEEADTMVAAWKSGDAGAVEAISMKSLKEDSSLYPIYEKILFERNRNMAKKIEGLLTGGATSFVVVGAAHLVGEKGILRLLEGRGYSLEQL
ncbi:MAG: TraB/GumN family protein [Syntrophales bacterium]|nr:TraB/GumN family protein [Syntrophales bacterium]